MNTLEVIIGIKAERESEILDLQISCEELHARKGLFIINTNDKLYYFSTLFYKHLVYLLLSLISARLMECLNSFNT